MDQHSLEIAPSPSRKLGDKEKKSSFLLVNSNARKDHANHPAFQQQNLKQPPNLSRPMAPEPPPQTSACTFPKQPFLTCSARLYLETSPSNHKSAQNQGLATSLPESRIERPRRRDLVVGAGNKLHPRLRADVHVPESKDKTVGKETFT